MMLIIKKLLFFIKQNFILVSSIFINCSIKHKIPRCFIKILKQYVFFSPNEETVLKTRTFNKMLRYSVPVNKFSFTSIL